MCCLSAFLPDALCFVDCSLLHGGPIKSWPVLKRYNFLSYWNKNVLKTWIHNTALCQILILFEENANITDIILA